MFRIVVAAMVALLQCAISVAYASPPYPKTPSGITDASRDATTYRDFMRLLWVNPMTRVDHVGRYDVVVNKRAFFTATTFIKPAVTVDYLSALVGNYWPSQPQDLVLMRCRPSTDQQQVLSPILATWPNVFSAIVSDFKGQAYSCPPDPNDGNNVMYCAALGYQDSAESVFVTGLERAFASAYQIFQNSGSSPGAQALKKNYGIYPAFTGLGFAVKTSGTVSSMSTSLALRESIAPEYLLNNLTLADAGCRCIQVPQYGNAKTDDARHGKLVNVNFVWQKGKLQDGACPQVNRLPSATNSAFPVPSSASEVGSIGDIPAQGSPADQ